MPHLTLNKTANKSKNDGFASSSPVKTSKKPQKFNSSASTTISVRQDLEIPGRGLRFVCTLDSLPQEQFLWPGEAAAVFLNGLGDQRARSPLQSWGRVRQQLP